MDDSYYLLAQHYDAQHAGITTDVDFYRHLVRRLGGPVLELGCGTGRICLPLAEAGHAITALDASEPMLALALDKRHALAADLEVEFVAADMCDFTLGQRFATIIIGFNTLGHLHQRLDVERCFATVADHLEPGGSFVLAMFNPNLQLLTRKPDVPREISRYPDPDSGAEVVVTEHSAYDRASQVTTSHWAFHSGGQVLEAQLRLRMFFPQELEALLHYAGFEVREKFGDFDGSAFSSESRHQIFVARLAHQASNDGAGKHAQSEADHS